MPDGSDMLDLKVKDVSETTWEELVRTMLDRAGNHEDGPIPINCGCSNPCDSCNITCDG